MKIATQEIIDFLKIAYDGAVEFDKEHKRGVAYFGSIHDLINTVIKSHPEAVVKKFALNLLDNLENQEDFP